MRGKYTLSYYDREADCGLSGGPRQIILSTVGRGEDKSLQNFLDYMSGRTLVYHDDYIVNLMNAVKAVRANPFWAAEYHDLARLRDIVLRDGRVEMLKSALKKGAKAEQTEKDSFIKKYFCPLNKKFYGICIQKNGN